MAQDCECLGEGEERQRGESRFKRDLKKGSTKHERIARSQSYYRITVRCFSNFMRITYTQCVLFIHFRLPAAGCRHAFEPGPCLMLFWRRHINRKAGPELKDRKCAPPGTFYVNVLAFVCLHCPPPGSCACLFVYARPYLTLFFCSNPIRHPKYLWPTARGICFACEQRSSAIYLTFKCWLLRVSQRCRRLTVLPFFLSLSRSLSLRVCVCAVVLDGFVCMKFA